MYIVYGIESGEMLEFQTLKEAKAFIKDVARYDRENGLEGEKWIIEREDN